MKRLITTLILAASLGYMTTANAYFVRAFNVPNDGILVDSLINDGATSAQISVGTSLMSEVNLDDGTVKALLDISGTNMTGQAGGVFGDTVSFNDAIGTEVDFSFDYDGEITITNVDNQGSTLQYGIFANFFVFEAGSGADALNFSSIGTELFKRTEFISFLDPTVDVFEVISESLLGSLTIGAVQDFDVIASLSVFTSTNDNDVSVTMDFTNTGTFGINTAPGVTYSSASGVFLNSVTNMNPNPPSVSEPGALALLFLGLAGLFVGRKRKA